MMIAIIKIRAVKPRFNPNFVTRMFTKDDATDFTEKIHEKGLSEQKLFVMEQDRKNLMKILLNMQKRSDPGNKKQTLHLIDILKKHNISHTKELERDLRTWKETVHSSVEHENV